jgi:polysaccharide pyruvyl transferase WcaK-like protein
MKVIILNHTGTLHHLGCFAAMYELETELRRRYGETVQIDRISSWVDASLGSTCCSRRHFDELVSRVEGCPILAEPLAGADLVILNGEGTLHWPAPNQRVWLWLALVEYFRRQSDRPIWVVNTSFFSDEPVFLRCAADVLNKVDHVALREPLSLAVARRAGIERVVQSADLVFLTPIHMVEGVQRLIEAEYRPEPLCVPGETIILLAGSSDLVPANRADWQEMFLRLVDRFTSLSVPLKFLFLAQSGMGKDIDLGRGLARQRPQVRLVSADLTPAEAVWLTHRADLVVSGRFHVNAFAVRCGTPVIMLPGNTGKNAGLAQLADSEYCRYSELDDAETLFDTCFSVFGDRRSRRYALEEKLRVLAQNNFPQWNGSADAAREVDWPEYVRQIRFAHALGEQESAGHVAALESRLGRLRELVDNKNKLLADLDTVRGSLIYRVFRRALGLMRCFTRPFRRKGRAKTDER